MLAYRDGAELVATSLAFGLGTEDPVGSSGRAARRHTGGTGGGDDDPALRARARQRRTDERPGQPVPERSSTNRSRGPTRSPPASASSWPVSRLIAPRRPLGAGDAVAPVGSAKPRSTRRQVAGCAEATRRRSPSSAFGWPSTAPTSRSVAIRSSNRVARLLEARDIETVLDVGAQRRPVRAHGPCRWFRRGHPLVRAALGRLSVASPAARMAIRGGTPSTRRSGPSPDDRPSTSRRTRTRHRSWP